MAKTANRAFPNSDDRFSFGHGNNVLVRLAAPEHAFPVAKLIQDQAVTPDRLSNAKVIASKIVVLTVLGVALGFGQGWASSRTYKPEHVAGFHLGLLHGMLMPAALPGLLLGKDLPIYAPNNSGRAYNIGYIFGINTCGTIFFGIGFWQPRRRGHGKKTERG